MVGYDLISEGQSVQLGILRGSGAVSPPSDLGQCPGGGEKLLNHFLNIDLKKVFEGL